VLQPFGEDHERQFIYKEPKVTTLAELTLRLQKLFIRKFGAKDIVHIIKESGKVHRKPRFWPKHSKGVHHPALMQQNHTSLNHPCFHYFLA